MKVYCLMLYCYCEIDDTEQRYFQDRIFLDHEKAEKEVEQLNNEEGWEAGDWKTHYYLQEVEVE